MGLPEDSGSCFHREEMYQEAPAHPCLLRHTIPLKEGLSIPPHWKKKEETDAESEISPFNGARQAGS